MRRLLIGSRTVGLLLPLAFALSVSVAAAAEVDEHMAPAGCAGQPSFCQQSGDQFRSEYPQALRGSYQAQRNVAFCLITGCDGAVRIDRITGCAWRAVIVSSGAKQVDQTDTSNFRSCRNQLDEVDMTAALAKAQQLFRRVYKRSMR